MTNNKKHSLGVTSRNIWLKNRTFECIDAIYNCAENNDLRTFKRMSLSFAEELIYALTEWSKYYPDEDGKE